MWSLVADGRNQEELLGISVKIVLFSHDIRTLQLKQQKPVTLRTDSSYRDVSTTNAVVSLYTQLKIVKLLSSGDNFIKLVS